VHNLICEFLEESVCEETKKKYEKFANSKGRKKFVEEGSSRT
jgi:hypothetical protein